MIQEYLHQCIEVQLAVPFVILALSAMFFILFKMAKRSYKQSQALKKGIQIHEINTSDEGYSIFIFLGLILIVFFSAVIIVGCKSKKAEPRLSSKYTNHELVKIIETKLQPLSDSADACAQSRDAYMKLDHVDDKYIDSAIIENERLEAFERKIDSVSRVYGMDSVFKKIDKLKETNPELF